MTTSTTGHAAMSPAPGAPEPAGGRFVRHLEIRVERLDGPNAGKLRVSSPQARGWAVTVRGPDQLWHAVSQAITEATIAGYARWQGARYDQDELTAHDDPTEPTRAPVLGLDEDVDAARRRVASYASGAVSRPDVADPADWRPNPDGTWSSPRSARRWRADSKYVRRVIAKRRRLGLPTTYAEHVAMTGGDAS